MGKNLGNYPGIVDGGKGRISSTLTPWFDGLRPLGLMHSGPRSPRPWAASARARRWRGPAHGGSEASRARRCRHRRGAACVSAQLVSFIHHAGAEGFIRQPHLESLLVSDDPGELIDQMAAYQHPNLEEWVAR